MNQALWARSSASAPNVKFCIQVPMLDENVPMKIQRKARFDHVDAIEPGRWRVSGDASARRVSGSAMPWLGGFISGRDGTGGLGSGRRPVMRPDVGELDWVKRIRLICGVAS